MTGALRVALLGGTGRVGAPLCEWLTVRGHEVTVLTRGEPERPLPVPVRLARWIPGQPPAERARQIQPADAVVNLARSPLPGRSSRDIRRAVMTERLNLVRDIVSAIRAMSPRPRVFVCGSSHDIYGTRDSAEALDESAAAGEDFFSRLYREIEREARVLEADGVRVVLARLGVVLGRGGNDPRVLPHVVASPSGALTWLHIADAVEMLERALVDSGLTGPVNMAAPTPTTATDLRDLALAPRQDRRAALRRRLLSTNGELAAAASTPPAAPPRSEAAAVDWKSAAADFQSRSHWAYPAKLMRHGYRWRVTSISDALERGATTSAAGPAATRPAFGTRSTVRETGDIPVSWTEAGSGYPLVVCSAAALPYEYWIPLLRVLSVRYRTYFLHPRGLWGGHLPADPSEMTVSDHARDLAFLVRHLHLREYGVVGHCAGVPVILAGLPLLAVRPGRVLLVSARLSPGPSLANFGGVTERVRTDPRFRTRYARVGAAYAPPELQPDLADQLTDARQLEAHVHAVQSVREHPFDDPWPDGVTATLAWASADAEEIRLSMREYAERLGRRSRGASELAGDHFTFLNEITVAARLVESAFGEEAHGSVAGA
jgi:hypothetical protein